MKQKKFFQFCFSLSFPSSFFHGSVSFLLSPFCVLVHASRLFMALSIKKKKEQELDLFVFVVFLSPLLSLCCLFVFLSESLHPLDSREDEEARKEGTKKKQTREARE